MNDVTLSPLPRNRKVFTWLGTAYRLSIDGDCGLVRPPGNSQIKSKIRRLGGRDRDFNHSVPGIICFLGNLEANAIFQMPIQFRIVIKVQVNAVVAGAVKVSWQRSKSTLQVGWTAGRVVPWVANLFSRGWIERQRVAIAI